MSDKDMRSRTIISLAAIAAVAFASATPIASNAACCDTVKAGGCSGADFISIPDIASATEPVCGCTSEYPKFVGCSASGGTTVGCCQKFQPTQQTCEALAGGPTSNFICQDASKACDTGWTQNPAGFCPPDGTQKCCIKAKAGDGKPAAVPPKKAAPTPPLLNPLGTENVSVVLGRVASIFMGLAGSVALLMFVYGGFTWITSGGSSERIKHGKDTMIWAVIGIAFIFSSYAILSYLLRVFSATT